MTEKSKERLALEAAADRLGLKYPANIGDAKLAARVEEASGELVGTIKVTGPRNGRRRAGRHFTSEPVLIDLEDLTAAQVAAIQADHLLKVELLVLTED